MTLSTPDAGTFSATECVPLTLALTCNGTPTPGTINLQSRYLPNPTVGPGSFFPNASCSGPALSTSSLPPGPLSFRSASIGAGVPLVGGWELSASALGASTTVPVTLTGRLRASVPTQLPLNACTVLASPIFVGLNDSSPVAFWSALTFSLSTLPSGVTLCAGSNGTFTISASQSQPTSMPSLRPTILTPGVEMLVVNDQTSSGFVQAAGLAVVVCLPAGATTALASDCCGGGAVQLTDGGYVCP